MTVEELHVFDAHRSCAGALLGLPHPRGGDRVESVDAGLPAGDEEVGDLLAVTGPTRDRSGGAVLEVVGMGDDAERASSVGREGEQVGHRRVRRRVAARGSGGG
jgi:hypothetical protein